MREKKSRKKSKASKRTTAELIEDLKAEALALKLDGKKTLLGVQLIVAFEKRVEFVMHDDKNALNKLNDCVRRGGEPIGLLTVIKTGELMVDIQSKTLAEYNNEPWARELLNHLADCYAAELKKGNK